MNMPYSYGDTAGDVCVRSTETVIGLGAGDPTCWADTCPAEAAHNAAPEISIRLSFIRTPSFARCRKITLCDFIPPCLFLTIDGILPDMDIFNTPSFGHHL